MSEFELLRKLRDLRGEQMPERDLWPQIAARIDANSAALPRQRRFSVGPRMLAVAASVALLAAVAALLLPHASTPDSRSMASTSTPHTTPPLLREAQAMRANYASARRIAALSGGSSEQQLRARPDLAAADRQLERASGELLQAIAAQPDAIYLLSLLRRTEEERLRLNRSHAA